MWVLEEVLAEVLEGVLTEVCQGFFVWFLRLVSASGFFASLRWSNSTLVHMPYRHMSTCSYRFVQREPKIRDLRLRPSLGLRLAGLEVIAVCRGGERST